MERLSGKKTKFGLNGNALRTWGLLFLAAGIFGRGIIQTQVLGIRELNAEQLLAVLGRTPEAMLLATASLVLQAMETCAVPVFALLLVEGARHTTSFGKYFLRVAGLAVLCEIPYNLAISGQWFDTATRNPVFGLVLCLVMFYFYGRYPEKKAAHTLMRILVTALSVIWSRMLGIDFGAGVVLITAAMWIFRDKPMYRNFSGAIAAAVSSAFSPFFLAAPMGLLLTHFYNEEKSTNSRAAKYLAYPAVLVAAAAIGFLI